MGDRLGTGEPQDRRHRPRIGPDARALQQVPRIGEINQRPQMGLVGIRAGQRLDPGQVKRLAQIAQSVARGCAWHFLRGEEGVCRAFGPSPPKAIGGTRLKLQQG